MKTFNITLLIFLTILSSQSFYTNKKCHKDRNHRNYPIYNNSHHSANFGGNHHYRKHYYPNFGHKHSYGHKHYFGHNNYPQGKYYKFGRKFQIMVGSSAKE